MSYEFWNGQKNAHRRVMMKACGYSDEDIRNKPHIGVPNAFMEGSPGCAHLRQITEAVKQGIWEAGGVPVEFGIPATCGDIGNGIEEYKYEQVIRDVVTGSIEMVAKIHNFDGLCMVSTCDNVIAGCYLAAARVNVPAMVVTGGSMQAGNYCGKTVVQADVDIAAMGGATEDVVTEMEEIVCPTCGACPSMGTANTMQMLGEVMNLVMPGTGTIPASDQMKMRRARTAGKYIVELTKSGRRPSDYITREVLMNAIMFDMAVAGSTNAVLHIIAMGNELGIHVTMEDFERYAEEIQCITSVIPSGPYTVVDFHGAGGVPRVMKMLERKLFLEAPTLDGRTWGELLQNVSGEPNDVIHTMDDPVWEEPGLRVLRGNLSPHGAIVRPTGVPKEMKKFRGKAKCYDNDSKALAAIEAGEIKAGDVIVLRYEGCKGAPGMKEMIQSSDAIQLYGLQTSVGLVTDARFSGFCYGPIVGHVSPEAYEGGLIALVEDGDEIIVDTQNGELTLNVPDEILEERRKHWVRPPLKVKSGILNLYARTCRPAHEGGAMQPWTLPWEMEEQEI